MAVDRGLLALLEAKPGKDPWDVTSPDGTRIEVKSSGFLQAWAQKKLSVPTFRVPPAYGWDAMTGTWSTQQGYHADVYVFCLHTATSHDDYDPLKVSQWNFFVVGKKSIATRAGAQMGLATLAKIAGNPVTYPHLQASIAAVAEDEDTLEP